MDAKVLMASSLLALAGFLLTIRRTPRPLPDELRGRERRTAWWRELWAKNGPQVLGATGASILFIAATAVTVGPTAAAWIERLATTGIA